MEDLGSPPSETDDEVHITDGQQKAMLALELLDNNNDSNLMSMSDRVKEANSKSENVPINEDRKRVVAFKDEVESQEYNYSEVANKDELEDGNKDETDNKDGEIKDSPILVEKEGNYELVDAKDVVRDKSQSEISEDTQKTKKSNVRAKTAPSSGPQRYQPSEKPSSNNNNDLCHRGHRTPEQIEEARNFQREKRRKEKEENERREREEAERMEENMKSFNAWRLAKEDEAKRQREKERKMKRDIEEKENEQQNEKEKKISMKDWLEMKRKQHKQEQKLEKLRSIELSSACYVRSQEECEKAFKTWLKRKALQEKERDEHIKSRLRTRSAITHKSRKSAQIAEAVRIAQQFRYVDYYGYRN